MKIVSKKMPYSHKLLQEEEKKAKRQAIAQVILQSLRRQKEKE